MKSLKNLNPYERHKLVINEYVLNRPGNTRLLKRNDSKDKRDVDVIRENHKFLWDDDDNDDEITWEQRLAKKYYDKLFKEYCICDLSRYKENKVALRWRIENEVVRGVGQFICGNKICSEKIGLRTWEVNFAYMEQNEKKNALVKLRLCTECSGKLNYRSKKREIKRNKERLKHNKSHRKVRNQSKCSADSIDPQNTDINQQDMEENKEESENENEQEKPNVDDDDIWKETPKPEEEHSREEEFEKYLEDLLF